MNRITNNAYYLQPESDTYKARLVAAEEDKAGWLLEFDDTIFYPEGGGQPADKGLIDQMEVKDVRKKDGRVLHLCSSRPKEEEVLMSLDREHRDFFCIQHTGQHLISYLMQSMAGAGTLSVHLGREETTVETDAVDLTEQTLGEIEEKAREMIARALPVTSFVVDSREELERYDIRRSTDQSEEIRLVRIEGCDLTPCGGLHADNTSRLGLIKYAGREKIRGNLRLKWKIGSPAFEDYRTRFALCEKTGALLGTPPYETIERLEALLEEKQKEKKRADALEDELAVRTARRLKNSITSFPPLILKNLDSCDGSLFRKIVRELSGEGLSFLLCAAEGERLHWALHLPGLQDFDFNAFRNASLKLIEGKGGGRGPLWQGSGKAGGDASSFLESLRPLL